MSAVTVFLGELSISDVCARFESLKRDVREGAKNGERFLADCEGVSELDVAAGQALIALKKECLKHNREFALRLSGPAAERLARLGITI